MKRTQRIGRYYLTQRIGYGGMAEIFRGVTYDRQGHQVDVAIKKLLPHFVEDKQFVVMLTDEFKLVNQLRHPNIAKVYELARSGNHLLISMEFVDGKDLRTAAERARTALSPFDFSHIAYMLAKALEGLDHAHRASDKKGRPLRLVHRDFTPSNILLGYNGRIKICDFGIAKASQSRVQTRSGVIKGKVKYMSPEQASGEPLDHRSDIFSAGSVLYELCTGEPPFHAQNEIDLIFKVREAQAVDCQKANPNIPDELAGIVRKAMAGDPAQRFATAADFRDALLTFLAFHDPTFRRARLARTMKHLFRKEIDDELRTLEAFAFELEERGPMARTPDEDPVGLALEEQHELDIEDSPGTFGGDLPAETRRRPSDNTDRHDRPIQRSSMKAAPATGLATGLVTRTASDRPAAPQTRTHPEAAEGTHPSSDHELPADHETEVRRLTSPPAEHAKAGPKQAAPDAQHGGEESGAGPRQASSIPPQSGPQTKVIEPADPKRREQG